MNIHSSSTTASMAIDAALSDQRRAIIDAALDLFADTGAYGARHR